MTDDFNFDFEAEGVELLKAYKGLGPSPSRDLAEFFEQLESDGQPLHSSELKILRFVSRLSRNFCGHMEQEPPHCDIGILALPGIGFSPERVKTFSGDLDGLDMDLVVERYQCFADVPLLSDGSYQRWPANYFETYFRQVVPFWREAANRGLGILYARL